ncbi:MAG: hypothetical protein HGA81_00570 [Chlorobium limicola]|nr:hypothetical protein [Chlorobium limicola]
MNRISKEKAREISPVMAGIILMAVVYLAGDYLQIWATILLLIAGAGVAELFCRKVFQTEFIATFFPGLFKQPLKKSTDNE